MTGRWKTITTVRRETFTIKYEKLYFAFQHFWHSKLKILNLLYLSQSDKIFKLKMVSKIRI